MPPPNNRPLHMAFLDVTSPVWPAGIQYLNNLFAALKSLDYLWQPDITLLRSNQTDPDSYDTLGPYIDHLIDIPPDPLWLRLWQRLSVRIPKRMRVLLAPKPPLTRCLREHQVDLVFAATEFGPRFPLPLLSWITDFQHLHLTALFSPEEIQARPGNAPGVYQVTFH